MSFFAAKRKARVVKVPDEGEPDAAPAPPAESDSATEGEVLGGPACNRVLMHPDTKG